MATPRLIDVTQANADARAGANKLRVVFIPWPYEMAGEWITKTEQWNHGTGNKFEIVFFTPNMPSRAIAMANDHPNATIYLRGHGAAGVADIQVKIGEAVEGQVQQMNKLHITEACDRLIASGLKKSFAGALKFFHCYSGTVMDAGTYDNHVANIKSNNTTVKRGYQAGGLSRQQRDQFTKPLEPNKSIARTAADYLRGKGFRSCTYYGYLGPLQSEYADEGGGGWHKYVDTSNLQGTALVGTVRASLGRVQV